MSGYIEYTDPADVHPPTGPYSHIVKIPIGAQMLFLSGQFGVKADGTVSESVYEQADQVFKNLFALLRSEGLDFKSVIKLTTFIVAGQDSREVRRA